MIDLTGFTGPERAAMIRGNAHDATAVFTVRFMYAGDPCERRMVSLGNATYLVAENLGHGWTAWQELSESLASWMHWR